MGRREDEVPSIDTPLEHEGATETAHGLETRNPDRDAIVGREHDLGWEI
jgi:hypothetical protein